MAQNRSARLITKRTTVPGKIPTGTTGNEGNLIQSGELASNLPDRKLWGYDGTDVFEYGSKSFFGLTGGTITGDTRIIGNLSASTFYSGSTDLETIIRNISDEADITRVQPGTNITTGGTGNFPTINLNNNIILDSVSGTTLSGGTIYSGSTGLDDIFVYGVIGGTNINTSGSQVVTVNLDDDIEVVSASATTMSATTFYGNGSGLTNVGLRIKTGILANTDFTGNPDTATVTFATPFTDNNYTVTVTGGDERSWTIESKTASGFVVNSNNNKNPDFDTYWQAIGVGEY